MRNLTTAIVWAAIAVSALSLAHAPASAIETGPAALAPRMSAVTLTQLSRRCRNWLSYCEVRHPDKGGKFRGCMAIHGCAGA